MSKNNDYKQGVACAILCAVLWGLLPVYWKALYPIDSFVIIYYRIFFVFLFALAGSLMAYGWKKTWAPLKEKGVGRTFFLSGLLITCNWSIYIWAVTNNYVIQTCIGYYIEPLMVCSLGVVLFKEELTKYKKLSLIIASIAVVVIIVYYRQLPLIALLLGSTFAIYSAVKRKFKMTAVIALLYETMFLAPVALAAIFYVEYQGVGAFAVAAPYQLWMMPLMGFATGIPLMLFAMAANRVPLVTLGLIEYISPSLTLILGIFLFKEPFDFVQFIAFIIIWVGLAVFTLGELKMANELNATHEGEKPM